MSTVILRFTARIATPIMVLLSLYFLLRGHNAPGGGFIAALVVGAAVILQYFAYGLDGVRRFLPLDYTTILALGLVLAVGIGLLSLALGGAFLEMAHTAIELPLVGHYELSASLVFDIGVYLIVTSMVVSIVRHLGREDP